MVARSAVSRHAVRKVDDHRVVALRLKVVDDEGEVLEETPEDAPYVYLHGQDQLLGPVERALDGKEPGDRVELTVPPDDAFGERLAQPERTVPRDVLPSDVEPRPGTAIALEEDGEIFPVWIVAATDAHLRVSLSHPWAGKQVTFEAEVLKVREPTPEELERGRPDGV